MAKKQLTDLKGYYGVVKGIVITTEDPDNLGRVKVQIPSYHGNTEDPDKLPWAQVCVNRTPASGAQGFMNAVDANGGGLGGTIGAVGDMLTGDYATSSANLSMAPAKGDVVWVIFEGGDINYPLVIGVLYSTIGTGGGTASISGVNPGSPAYMMAQIMMKYESNNNYGAFAEAYANTSNEHAITIGAHQNYGVNAKALMVYLRSLNQSEFDKMASPSGLLADVTGSNDWSNYRIAKSSAKGQAIIAIMTTSWGINGQITKAAQDVQRYMKEANEDYGVTDVSATLYICDIIHQYGRGGARKQYKGKSIPNLETAYQIAISYSTTYKTRRTGVYNDLKQLRDSGKLNGNGSTSSDSENTISTLSDSLYSDYKEIDITKYREKFLFPLREIRKITKYFEKEINPVNNRTIFHDGIDIYDKNIIGKPVIAVFDGVVSYRTDLNPYNGCGYEITITQTENNNIQAIYRHLNKRIAKEGSFVKQGEVIGIVGNTGSADFPMLHFSIKINGGYQNPLTYLTNEFL